ncbi:MAG: hypothetical protein GF364_04390 [Candidatus Lokiarchaeota archaeon]|nr:hypothetical protein [Candidatus Lokiarchaeota archaeon]
MKEMKPFERVWTTLNHEEPDRVPIYEGSIEPHDLTQGQPALYFQPGILHYSTDILSILTKRWSIPGRKIAFKVLNFPQIILPFIKPGFMMASKWHRNFGIDLMGFAGGFPMNLSEKVFKDYKVKDRTVFHRNGEVVTKISDNFGAVSRFGFLKSPEDYYRCMEFNPDHPANYILVRKGLEAAKGKIALYFTVYGAAYFETLCDMFGFKTLFRLLHRNKSFIKKVVKDLSDFAVAQVEHLAARGVKLFYMSSDLGGNTRLMLSPRMWRDFFQAGVTRFCRKVHSYGGKVIMHSCGNSLDLIDTLITCGIDALHPWQPYANMDIFQGKQKWGDKLTLIGNVSIELLSQEGKTHEVVEYVKKLMKEVKPGGGYILSSSHSLVPTVKWKNAVAMWWAAKKYGKY